MDMPFDRQFPFPEPAFVGGPTSKGVPMPQAVVDPEELRRFAMRLKKFNSELQNQSTLLANQLTSLGSTCTGILSKEGTVWAIWPICLATKSGSRSSRRHWRGHSLDRRHNHPFLNVAGYVVPSCHCAIAVPGRLLCDRQTLFVLEREASQRRQMRLAKRLEGPLARIADHSTRSSDPC